MADRQQVTQYPGTLKPLKIINVPSQPFLLKGMGALCVFSFYFTLLVSYSGFYFNFLAECLSVCPNRQRDKENDGGGHKKESVVEIPHFAHPHSVKAEFKAFKLPSKQCVYAYLCYSCP